MAQLTTERRIIDNSTTQLRLQEDLGGVPRLVMPNIQPTFKVNDELVDLVSVDNAERTSSGTSAIKTTNSSGKTWVTGFTLSMARSILGV